jgi:hypothetical protein
MKRATVRVTQSFTRYLDARRGADLSMLHQKRVAIARHTVLLPLMVFLLAINPAFAWDSFVGQESCAFVVEQIQAEEESATLIIAAFVTGVNFATGRLVDDNIEGMVSWVREFCERDPEARFLDALTGLDGELDARQVPAAEPARDATEPLNPGEGAAKPEQ